MLHHPVYAGYYRHGHRALDPRREVPGQPATGRTINKPEDCSNGGSSTSTSAPLVTTTGVQVVLNRRHRVDEVLISFIGALNLTEAASVAEYQVMLAGRRGSFSARGAKRIGLLSAAYDPAKDTVALIPAKPFALNRPAGVAVNFVRGPLALIRGRSAGAV